MENFGNITERVRNIARGITISSNGADTQVLAQALLILAERITDLEKQINNNQNPHQQTTVSMKEDEKKYWQYELKCRRCGSYIIYDHCSRNIMDFKRFDSAMKNMSKLIDQSPCDTCQKYTVHDLVGWDDPDSEDIFSK